MSAGLFQILFIDRYNLFKTVANLVATSICINPSYFRPIDFQRNFNPLLPCNSIFSFCVIK